MDHLLVLRFANVQTAGITVPEVKFSMFLFKIFALEVIMQFGRVMISDCFDILLET